MADAEELVVGTREGRLSGARELSVEGFEYCAFKGVPYAKPPLDDLRFKDPEPPKSWSGIRDAKNFGSVCAQYDAMRRAYDGSEDCLYLNLYVRSMDNVDVKKPVMVWFHGGGFMFGSGNDVHFGPDYLMRKDIVLITFNYRLGVFGFLNLENEVAPGNQGLKDQIMVLKWVQANVENFGGDPNNVTIFGESAGSLSVQYLAVSPLAKGLFHKAICQSASIFNPWSRLPDPRRYASQLCNNLGKYVYDPKEMYEFIKTVDSQRLVKAQEHVRRSNEKLKHIFPFMVALDNTSPNPIVPIPGEEAALQGIHVPLLIGYNNKEGISFLIGMSKEMLDGVDKNFSKIFEPLFPALLRRYNLSTTDLKKYYFPNKKVSNATSLQLAEMLEEWRFVEGIHRTMKVQVEKSSCPTYAYKFSYSERLTMMKSLFQFPIEGATHFDEIEYLFYGKMRKQLGFSVLKKGMPSYKLMEQMTEMWTNFATYGTPTPKTSDLIPVEWLPLDDGTNLRYLNIDKTLQMQTEKNIEQKLLAIKKSLKK